MTTPPADGRPTTRGTSFYLADPYLAFVCATVMQPGDLERARPHLAAMGEVSTPSEAAEIRPPPELPDARPV